MPDTVAIVLLIPIRRGAMAPPISRWFTAYPPLLKPKEAVAVMDRPKER